MLTWTVGKQVLDEFTKANPGISVQLEQVAFNQLFEQIQVRFGSGSETPDVISVDVPVTASYGKRGWLVPLDDVFSPEEKNDWLESSLKAGTYEGKLLSAPVSTSTQLLFVNKTMFNKANVTPPGQDDRWTWEQVADAGKKLQADLNKSGASGNWAFTWEQFNRIYQLQPLPVSLGGQAIGPDGLTVRGVIDAKPWIDAFTYYAKVFNEWKLGPQGEAVAANDMFESGKLAMFVGGPWNIPRFAKAKTNFEWGVSRHPYFQSGKVVTPTGSWHIGINPKSKNREAAQRLVHFISTGKGAELWWRYGSGDFPAQKSVLKLFDANQEFAQPPLSYMKVAANEATQNPVPRPVSVGYLEYEQILADTFNDIRNGAAQPEPALKTAVDRIESEMAKYK